MRDRNSRQLVSKLNDLLTELNIKRAFYIDDFNGLEILPELITSAKDQFVTDRLRLREVFGSEITYEFPDENFFGDQLDGFLQGKGRKEQLGYLGKLLELENDANSASREFFRSKKLESFFPRNLLKVRSPDDWESVKRSINRLKKDEKALILFDQDLSRAEGERFRNGTIKGQHLIWEIKSSKKSQNVYCTLITQLIDDTSKELHARDEIAEELGDEIQPKDFFALSKKRIENAELLCDGIKKALLNGYCEEIKEKSTTILDKAYRNAIKKINKLDPYDFDHTILRSSYGEGVWEVNTLIRITNSIYFEEVRDLMRNGFPKLINPTIKKTKKISDIRFDVPSEFHPYREKLQLRHSDIYEKGELINELHYPLENGDIFKVVEGTKRDTYFILVSQECDLMVRSHGSRGVKNAVLLRIIELPTGKLKSQIDAKRHYFQNKFHLQYFFPGSDKEMVVDFLEPYIIDLDILDLCVFDRRGLANIDLESTFDKDLVSSSWEKRYDKLYGSFKAKATNFNKLISDIEIKEVPGSTRKEIKRTILNNLSPFQQIGKPMNLSGSRFDFGIKRVLRFKRKGASYLLDRHSKHMSRVAEDHDFVSGQ
jgi:hypothetical protein